MLSENIGNMVTYNMGPSLRMIAPFFSSSTTTNRIAFRSSVEAGDSGPVHVYFRVMLNDIFKQCTLLEGFTAMHAFLCHRYVIVSYNENDRALKYCLIVERIFNCVPS